MDFFHTIFVFRLVLFDKLFYSFFEKSTKSAGETDSRDACPYKSGCFFVKIALLKNAVFELFRLKDGKFVLNWIYAENES